MQNGYNRISGKKTLALVIILIALILFLTVYSVYLMLRKSSVLTKSTSYDKPMEINKIQEFPTKSPRQNNTPDIPTRFGD